MIKSVQLIRLPCYEEDECNLVVAEGNEIPFSIVRVFNVKAKRESVRGKHAHRVCTQLLICTNGSIEVRCDDSNSTEVYLLDKPNYGLIIKPGIWAEQKYLEDNTVLTVLCDSLYEEDEYICSYEEFKAYHKNY